MSEPFELETWVVEVGGEVVQKWVEQGEAALTPIESLIYCLWVADYGMRNAGDLETATDLYAPFQNEAARLAAELGLRITHGAFALPKAALQNQYFDLFDGICEEIRVALGEQSRRT